MYNRIMIARHFKCYVSMKHISTWEHQIYYIFNNPKKHCEKHKCTRWKDTMIIYNDNFTTLSSHQTFIAFEVEYIITTFNANTK
jgi:hypothetical protein